MEKLQYLRLPELELRPLVRPARIQLLYRLGYRGSLVQWICLPPDVISLQLCPPKLLGYN
jgi:hypothetical protein